MAVNEKKKMIVNELKALPRLRTAKRTLTQSLAEYDLRSKTFQMSERAIEKIKEINMNIAVVTLEINAIERAFETLTYDERRILEKFYINRTENAIGELCKEFNLEIAHIYRLKDRALEHYSISKYGKSYKS